MSRPPSRRDGREDYDARLAEAHKRENKLKQTPLYYYIKSFNTTKKKYKRKKFI